MTSFYWFVISKSSEFPRCLARKVGYFIEEFFLSIFLEVIMDKSQ